MRLVRFVAEPTAWRKALTIRDDGNLTLPLVAIRAITPTHREGTCISLYKLVDEDTVPRLAAAYWLKQKEPFALIAIEEEYLTEAGAVFDETVKGNTYHPDVNDLHVDLKIDTGNAAIDLARVFFERGELLAVEANEIKSSIADDNKEGLVDFKKLAKDKNIQCLNNLGDLLSGEVLVLTTP
jgi:hypothetical protein